MTSLVHDCSILNINVDTARLYEGDDPNYELWLVACIDRVSATRRRAAREQERRSKSK